MNRTAASLAALVPLLVACAGAPIPCPSELALYGGREWGVTRNTYGAAEEAHGKHGRRSTERFEDSGRYKGYQAGAELRFDLQQRRDECPAYGGSPLESP